MTSAAPSLDAERAADGAASLSFRRYSFGFRARGKIRWILRNVDLEVRAGRFYLLTGPSGVGKSTLIDLLAREIDPGSSRWAQRGTLVDRVQGTAAPPRRCALPARWALGRLECLRERAPRGAR